MIPHSQESAHRFLGSQERTIEERAFCRALRAASYAAHEVHRLEQSNCGPLTWELAITRYSSRIVELDAARRKMLMAHGVTGDATKHLGPRIVRRVMGPVP